MTVETTTTTTRTTTTTAPRGVVARILDRVGRTLLAAARTERNHR